MEDQTQQFLQQEAQRAADELGVKPNVEANVPAPVEAPVAEPVAEAPQASEAAPVAAPEPPAPAPVIEDDDDESDIPTFVPTVYQQPQAPVQQPTVPQPQQVQQFQQPQQLPALDPSQFTDQYGNVDMARFTQAMRSRDEALVAQVTSNLTTRLTGDLTDQITRSAIAASEQATTRQIMAAEAEKRAWEKTFERFPQVKTSKDLRDQIHKMRLGEIAVTGKPVSPSKIAERYFSQIAQAREDGVRQAVETTKVQATAHLETANNTASDKGLKAQKDWSNISSRDRQTATSAREDLLKQMLADGQL